jgi:ABC-2 type transport system ATP-binding protein
VFERDVVASFFQPPENLLYPQYSEVTAFQDVSFAIDAGKTTTLKMLSGLLHPSSGAATVAGHFPMATPRILGH